MAIQIEEGIRRTFALPELILQNGQRLTNGVLAYETFGNLNLNRDNAILICHALTGDSHVAGTEAAPGWWEGLVGPGKAIDTDRFFVICPNVLGGCSGSSGPTMLDPERGKPYGMSFPTITIRDMVQAEYQLVKSLGIPKLHAVIGGSMGGMQVYEWGIMHPGLMENLIPIATSGRFSAMGIAYNNVMRQAIYNDPNWRDGDYYGHSSPDQGLDLARRIAMITYRSFAAYDERFGRTLAAPVSDPYQIDSQFQVESYLRYQGSKLVKRFDANSYLYLLKAMDLHDIAVGRGDYCHVLSKIQARTLFVGIDSDILFPAAELRRDADYLQWIGKDAVYREIKSIHGHDAFLIEYEQINQLIEQFLKSGGADR